MNNNIIGTLEVYPEERDTSKKNLFTLKEGEYIIGSGKNCDIILAFPNITPRHCKLTISADGSNKIEDLGGQFGVFRMTPSNPRQKLRPNTKYDLVPSSPFYLANKYKCLFETGSSGKKFSFLTLNSA